jgi:uncharacterized protein (TIGR03086 family)
MTPARPRVELTGGVALLERAVGYALGSLRLVTPEAMANPTPCREWDLRALLLHLNDSLLALHEAVAERRVALEPATDGGPAGGLVAALRSEASRTLGAWTNAGSAGPVSIGGRPLTADVVAAAGAVEVAVHGWDVARACGQDRPVPAMLAEELLALVPRVVTDADRPGRFAAPVPVPRPASPGDRLVAFLGRR